MEKRTLMAQAHDSGMRADKFISTHMEEISRSYAAALLEDGRVMLENGEPVKKNYQVREGDVFTLSLPEAETLAAVPEDLPLDIVYEDRDLIVVNKPQGMVVHPAAGNYTGTLVNALLYHCGGELSAINGVIRPGIVHRIDKDTSGLLVAAKNNEAHLALAAQLKERKAVRKYEALVNGRLKTDGTVDKPIARNPADRKKMAVVQGGREAVTHYRILELYDRYTFVECTLETGRTHQIRVHMASIGHSIVGDPVYGSKKDQFKLNGQLLHAKTIGFVHPRTGKYMEFSSELPGYFKDMLHKLKK